MPRPVSLVAFAYLGDTLQLAPMNCGIFTVDRVSVVTSGPYTNRNVFFDSTYTAEYLTTLKDIYLHVEQVVFVFCFFLSCVWMYTVRPSSQDSA
jgi:hypothetical protein